MSRISETPLVGSGAPPNSRGGCSKDALSGALKPIGIAVRRNGTGVGITRWRLINIRGDDHPDAASDFFHDRKEADRFAAEAYHLAFILTMLVGGLRRLELAEARDGLA